MHILSINECLERCIHYWTSRNVLIFLGKTTFKAIKARNMQSYAIEIAPCVRPASRDVLRQIDSAGKTYRDVSHLEFVNEKLAEFLLMVL